MGADDQRPLWERGGGAPVAPEDRVAVVHAFLVRARAWGTDREIPETMRRLRERVTAKDAARLHQWSSWVEFVDHALAELESGRLDDWFRDAGGV